MVLMPLRGWFSCCIVGHLHALDPAAGKYSIKLIARMKVSGTSDTYSSHYLCVVFITHSLTHSLTHSPMAATAHARAPTPPNTRAPCPNARIPMAISINMPVVIHMLRNRIVSSKIFDHAFQIKIHITKHQGGWSR